MCSCERDDRIAQRDLVIDRLCQDWRPRRGRKSFDLGIQAIAKTLRGFRERRERLLADCFLRSLSFRRRRKQSAGEQDNGDRAVETNGARGWRDGSEGKPEREMGKWARVTMALGFRMAPCRVAAGKSDDPWPGDAPSADLPRDQALWVAAAQLPVDDAARAFSLGQLDGCKVGERRLEGGPDPRCH